MFRKVFQEKKIVSFVRRKGRKLSKVKLDLLDNILPAIEINSLKQNEILTKIKAEKYHKINLEIGYGSGEHLIKQSQLYKEELFLGCEPFLNGTVKLLANIKEQEIKNIYIHQNDALALLTVLPDEFLSKIFILFPDPWPKTRHHKRRIIQERNLDCFYQKLKMSGLLRIATDHSDYASWIIAKMMKHKKFYWQINNIKDWYKEPQDWVKTKYQKKALAGRNYYFFDFIKISA